jgi:DNA-binding transcriptional LysR family regulator
MDKKDIEIFLAIVKEKSIANASTLLYYSSSTISSRLKMLEKELGVELIARHKGVKEISLTQKGVEFEAIAKNWISLWNECSRLRNIDANPYLSIATVDSLLEHGFVPLYRKLVYDESGFNLDIKRYPADMIYNLVSKKMVDIGFALYEMKYSDVKVEEIMSDEMVVITSKDSHLDGEFIHPEMLDPTRELYIGSKDNLNIGWGPVYKIWHDKWFDISINPLVSVTSITILSYFLSEGDFWSIIPLSNAMGLRKQYGIKILRLNPAPPNRIIYKLTHTSQSASTERNIEIFKKYLYPYIDSMKHKL